MPLTLGLTGMDPATETALKAAFEQANSALGNRFTLTGEGDARYVIVDMDSMYGPMSWLRLHGADKVVVGLTNAPRTQTDFRLARPFDASAVTALLRDIADKAGIVIAASAEPASQPVSPADVQKAPAPAGPEPPAAVPSGLTPAPAPQDELPDEHLQPIDQESRPPLETPLLAPVHKSADVTTERPPAIPVTTPDAVMVETVAAPEPPLPSRNRTLADWLAPTLLTGRVRYRHPNCPELLIDGTAREYYGPATLKPLQGCFEGAVERDAFVPVDDATWKTDTAKLGAAQRLSRLQWYSGLVAGKGGAALDADKHYRLGKWPQTEREFPKHFRIATVMMKGPATIGEIAATSGLPPAEVADFINANLTTGYAEIVQEAPAEPAEPAKPTGILGRLRGR
ncbi:MAG: hypothetical protein LH470_07695 [Lysobacter sp.]|nr:hypothetical protein [Lysobacter sp.]